MIRNSIVTKLWMTIVGMVILVFVLLSFLLQQFFYNYVLEQQTQQLTKLASSVQELMIAQDPFTSTGLAQHIATYVQNVNVTFSTPLSANAQLDASYRSFTASQREAFLASRPVAVRGTVNGVSEVSVYMILPNLQGQPGMLDITQEMSVLDAPLARMRNLILFASVLGVVLTTGLAFVVSKNLSRPLIQMNEVAEEMARGNFDRRVSVVTGDEVGRLGNTFNAVASELSQTIQVLSIERDQVSGILATLEDGVVAADLHGNVTLANPPALRWMRSMSVGEHGTAQTNRLPELLRGILNIVVQFKESIVREINWQSRHLIVTTMPLFESDGVRLRGVLSVLRDVTEEHRLDRLRKDFIANVSHELRTPLSMMQGYAEALLDEFGDNPVHRRELTEIIYDEALRMKRLVNDLLDLAQLESGQFQMKYALVDIGALVGRVARKFRTVAQDRGVAFIVDAPTHDVSVKADEDRVEQVLTNLLDNAFRHTSEGHVQVNVSVSARHVNVRISDTGSGIPEEDVPFIFERFYKADKARTRSRSGTGLGLAITRHIVLEHGGDILVTSQFGVGTEFTIVLPLAPSDGPEIDMQ